MKVRIAILAASLLATGCTGIMSAIIGEPRANRGEQEYVTGSNLPVRETRKASGVKAYAPSAEDRAREEMAGPNGLPVTRGQ